MNSWGVRLTWFDCNINSYFDKGCRKKCMHATIPKEIVGGFECTFFKEI